MHDYESAMIFLMTNENFRQHKSSGDWGDSGIDPQTFTESLTVQLYRNNRILTL